ncbi:MAG: hypothetical protein WCF90_03260 [Methanomicrobiales archaeon]
MGENAFVAYTVVGVIHFQWQTALGAVFICGNLSPVERPFQPMHWRQRPALFWAPRPTAHSLNLPGDRTRLTNGSCGDRHRRSLSHCPLISPALLFLPDICDRPALIDVGLIMLEPITHLDFSDYAEVIPSFTVIAMMSFTYNIRIVLCAGFVL